MGPYETERQAAADAIRADQNMPPGTGAALNLQQLTEVCAIARVLSELRLETADLRLLFATDPPNAAMLLVVGVGSDDWEEWYGEALMLARAELHLDEDDFAGYDLATFLSEYFPGEEAEVQARARRLIELNSTGKQ